MQWKLWQEKYRLGAKFAQKKLYREQVPHFYIKDILERELDAQGTNLIALAAETGELSFKLRRGQESIHCDFLLEQQKIKLRYTGYEQFYSGMCIFQLSGKQSLGIHCPFCGSKNKIELLCFTTSWRCPNCLPLPRYEQDLRGETKQELRMLAAGEYQELARRLTDGTPKQKLRAILAMSLMGYSDNRLVLSLSQIKQIKYQKWMIEVPDAIQKRLSRSN